MFPFLLMYVYIFAGKQGAVIRVDQYMYVILKRGFVCYKAALVYFYLTCISHGNWRCRVLCFFLCERSQKHLSVIIISVFQF